MSRHSRLGWLVSVAVLAGCTSSSTDSGDSLTVMGNAGSPVVLVSETALQDPTSGDPASLLIGMYALYISTNADCSSPVLVQDYGATASVKDFVNQPTLFSGSPDAGSYQCVAIKMSDVITVVPGTTFGTCHSGVQYPGDIYRDGETDWKDIDLNPITGTGTDAAPADDHVLLVMSRDTTAAIARGFSSNQVIDLGSDLVAPGHNTFYWHGENTVVDAGGQCGVNPGHPSFE